MDSRTAAKYASGWQSDGYRGFERWRADTRPMVMAKGRREVFSPYEFQRAELRRFFRAGIAAYVFSAPRRHGKTLCCALLVLHRFLTRKDQTILIGSSSLDQSVSVGFKMLRDIILATDALREIIGAENIKADRILFPALRNEIIALTASEPSSYGRGADIVWFTELGQVLSENVFQTLAAGTGDRGGIVIADSTVGPRLSGGGAALWRLHQMAEAGDKSVEFCHITWDGVSEPLTPLLTREWLEHQRKACLPKEYQRQHQNLWNSDETDSLFSHEEVGRCITVVPTLEQLREKYALPPMIAVGGDFSLVGSAHGDRSILATVAACCYPKRTTTRHTWTQAIEEEAEPEQVVHYYLLRLTSVPTEEDRQRELTEIKRLYRRRLIAVRLETYMAQATYEWGCKAGLPMYLSHPSRQVQAEMFAQYRQVVTEGRFRFGAEIPHLADEMRTFAYSTDTVTPTFGHKSDKFRDDCVYAVGHALAALKQDAEPAHGEWKMV